MKLMAWLIIAVFVGVFTPRSAFAFGPFPSIMDYENFVKLERVHQREYLSLIMRTMVDLEEGFRQLEKMPNTPANQELKKTSWLKLEEFKRAVSTMMDAVAIPSAHARSAVPANARYCEDYTSHTNKAVHKGSCIIGGWTSTFVTSPRNPKGYCQRPACSIDSAVRDRLVEAQQHCKGGTSQFACYPALYGYREIGNSKTPFCINYNKVGDHNASLACLMEFEKAPKKEERLDALIDRLMDPSTAVNRDAINNFNLVAERIFNICACGPENAARESDPTLRKNDVLSTDYVNYMQGHRTCYALMGMMKLYVDKIRNKGQTCDHLVINRSNLEQLSEDLGVLDQYTSRVSMLGTPADRDDFSTTLSRYKARFVTDKDTALTLGAKKGQVVAGDKSLDLVSAIDTKLDYRQNNKMAWCPLRLPPPLPIATPEPIVAKPEVKADPPAEVPPVEEVTEEEPIVVTGSRIVPIVEELPPIKTDVDITALLGNPPLIAEPEEPVKPQCTFTFVIIPIENSTSVKLTAEVTLSEDKFELPKDQNVSWTAVVGGKTTNWKDSRDLKLDKEIPGPITKEQIKNSSLKVEVPGCEACSLKDVDVAAGEKDAGACNLTATAGDKGKFTLALDEMSEDYTIKEVKWGESVTLPKDTEENALDLELATPAKPTAYSVTLKYQRGEGPVYVQQCSITYPEKVAAPTPGPVQPGPQQMSPNLNFSIFSTGQN